MRKIKHLIIALSVVLATSLIFTSAAGAQQNEWTEIEWQVTDDIKKPWTITFSQQVDESTITDENLYIENEQGHRIPITWEVTDSKVVVSPQISYTNQQNYQLIILSSVRSKTNTALSKNTRFPFHVNSQKVSEIPYVTNFEVKNTLNSPQSVKLPMEADYISYDQSGKVTHTGIGKTQSAVIPPNGTSILSFTAPLDGNLAVDEGLIASPTKEQAYIKTRQVDGGSTSWTTSDSNHSSFFIKGDGYDYAFYDQTSPEDFALNMKVDSTLQFNSNNKITVTAQPGKEIYVYAPARGTAFTHDDSSALVTADVEPGESLVIRNKSSEINHAKINTRTIYDYVEYPNPSANESDFQKESFREQDLLTVKGDGETVFTNRDSKTVTIFGPSERVALSATGESAFRELTLAPGESLHANYEISETLKDSVFLHISGTGLIDAVAYRQNHAWKEERNFSVDKKDFLSVVYGENFRGTAVTNRGDSELTFYLPHRFSSLEKTETTAFKYVTLNPGESTSVRTSEDRAVVTAVGDNANYRFITYADGEVGPINKKAGTIQPGSYASSAIHRYGSTIVENNSTNGEVLTVYAPSLPNEFGNWTSGNDVE